LQQTYTLPYAQRMVSISRYPIMKSQSQFTDHVSQVTRQQVCPRIILTDYLHVHVRLVKDSSTVHSDTRRHTTYYTDVDKGRTTTTQGGPVSHGRDTRTTSWYLPSLTSGRRALNSKINGTCYTLKIRSYVSNIQLIMQHIYTTWI